MLTIPVELPLRVDAHGAIRIGSSRVTLAVVVTSFRAGSTPEEIVMRFPTLGLADVYAAITFYLRNALKVDEYLGEIDDKARAQKARAEEPEPMSAIRARLLERQRLAS
jgi:uncharacterized protein (DUF433 family)